MTQNQQKSKKTRSIFEGFSFKYPPVSKEEYSEAYEEYVRRCSEKHSNVTTLEEYTKIVVETDEQNPKTIAVITADDIEPSDGFRVSVTPRYV
ncbi:hypothetical protein NGC25_13835 [Enterococcus faecalis]|uniref:hypothetical protein n=1 Tax=Enterococcus faecalis TaxID=1351 RepID=UPI002DB81ADF|nr:hypothetical protein [Enterococcus faecalis]MEB7428339.1 hypothetical protein [Enterococcus faecalis]